MINRKMFTEQKQILLVDDDEVFASIQIQGLQSEGYSVQHVTTGETAIEFCKTNFDSVDLILMDMDLGTGFDGANAAIEILKFMQIPIIFLSSHVEKVMVEKVEKIASYGYVLKNSGITVLAASIRMAFKLHEANSELSKEKEHLKSILLTAMDGFWLVDTQGKLIEVNDIYSKMSGYTLPELLGLHISDLEDVETKEEIAVHMKKIIEQGKDRFESRHRRKDGSIFDVELSVQYRSFDGGSFVVFIQDISKRKKEEEIVLENELKLKTILENILDAVLIINRRGIIQLANKSTETIFGYTASELIGKNINMLMPNPYKDEHDSYLLNYLETGKKKIIGIGREIVGIRKNEEIFPIELAISEWKFKNEIFFTGTVKDISYKKTVEEQLKQSQKLEALGQIAGGIAHDFNNILAILMGNLELIQRKIPSDNPSMLKKIESSLNAVERGSQLTKKLLAFARKQVFSPEIYDLNFIIQDMYEMIERVLGKQIKVDLKISELPLPILIDKNELENVILNLAINARDAMNDVGILTIRTRQVQNPKLANEEIHNSDNVFAELSIIDTGCGIPPHLMQKIFEPFFTTKPKGKGTGLGLSLTYGFIKQSNAHIHVYSEESKGTCFKLYFLIKDNQNYPKVESTKIIEKKDSLSQDKVVLVVDDEPSMLNIASSLLSDLGFQVITASNALDGKNILKKTSVNLVISDIIMPGEMNGITFASYIKENFPTVKIILTSGFPGHLHKDEDEELKKYTFIEKPYKTKDLEEIVWKELNN